MRTIVLILFLVAGAYASASAQSPVTEADIDQRSYEQFLNKQFSELKATVKMAEEQHIDFYYLRLRAGILAYNKKKYEYAIPQFKKALEFYPSDTLAKEYLYYAYLFSARKETARDFAAQQDLSFQHKVGYKKQPFDWIGIDGGAIITDNVASNRNNKFKKGVELGKAERTLNGNLYFGDFYFQNTIKNRLHINNSFSVFNTSSLYQIEVLAPGNTFKKEQEFNNLNFQYNLGLSYITRKEWEIGIGFGFYHVKGNTFTALQPDSINNTIPIQQDTIAQNSFLGSISIGKRCKYVKPVIQLSCANLNAQLQIQAEGGLTYYPLGNYNFYGYTGASFLRNGSNNQYVISQIIGFKVLNWWWNEVHLNYGNLSNYIVNNGFLTYNTSDAIKLRVGMDMNFYIKKHFQLGVGYSLQQRERTTQQYLRQFAGLVQEEQKSTYITHLIKSSLLWNF